LRLLLAVWEEEEKEEEEEEEEEKVEVKSLRDHLTNRCNM